MGNEKYSPWTRLGIFIGGGLLASWTVVGLAIYGAVEIAKIAGWIG